jgi:DNA-directed RNA polymerase subunit RPC12/RpoP
MSVKCTRCQSETCFKAEITGWSSGEVHRVFECPKCGRVDWHPTAPPSPAIIPTRRRDDMAALS